MGDDGKREGRTLKAHLVQGFTIERAGDNPHSETAMGAFKSVLQLTRASDADRDRVITRAYVNAIRYVPQGVHCTVLKDMMGCSIYTTLIEMLAPHG